MLHYTQQYVYSLLKIRVSLVYLGKSPVFVRSLPLHSPFQVRRQGSLPEGGLPALQRAPNSREAGVRASVSMSGVAPSAYRRNPQRRARLRRRRHPRVAVSPPKGGWQRAEEGGGAPSPAPREEEEEAGTHTAGSSANLQEHLHRALLRVGALTQWDLSKLMRGALHAAALPMPVRDWEVLYVPTLRIRLQAE